MLSIRDISSASFPAYCRTHGMKCTAQRLVVFNVVHKNNTHPSVDDVWHTVRAQSPTITRESVYRILNEFATLGLIERLDALTAARYDTWTSPHAHFICEACGKVTDYPLPDGFKSPAGIAGEQHHFELRITGICPKCLKRRH